MIYYITTGSLIRFFSTIYAAYCFAIGQVLAAVLSVIVFGVATWLELSREEAEDE